MRIPKQLSHSSLALWEKDREEFYLRHLAEHRAAKLPQERFMSIGSAFDAYVKSSLHAALFGRGADPVFEFETIFTSQVEPPNRDWAREEGGYVFQCYSHTGSYGELLVMLERAKEPPRFEFAVEGVIGGEVPFVGKPDCRFVHECGVHVILDWKVRGYCSQCATSPTKNYKLCRDGYDAIQLGVDATKQEPRGKQSRSHNTVHPGYLPCDHRGFEVNRVGMEQADREYADQLAIYGWLLGEQIGDENVAAAIDEIVARPIGDRRPLLRVANHRARVSRAHQQELFARIKACWGAITSGHVFGELPRQQSDERCQMLEEVALGLQSDGSPRDNWFNEVVRPRFRASSK